MATSGELRTADGATIEYATVGHGDIPIVLIPGASDGLNTVGNAAWQLRWLYRQRAARYHMLIFSRRIPFPLGFSVADQADDFINAVQQLDWPPSIWELNSAGGPVGQWVAVKRPDLTLALVLSSTLHRTPPYSRQILESWIAMAQAGRWADLTWDTIVHTYSERRQRMYRLLKPLIGLIARRSSYPGRFEAILTALLDIDHRDLLPQISCPVWISHGAEDRVIPKDIAEEMHELLPNSTITLYEGYGHGNEIENSAYRQDFDRFAVTVTT